MNTENYTAFCPDEADDEWLEYECPPDIEAETIQVPQNPRDEKFNILTEVTAVLMYALWLMFTFYHIMAYAQRRKWRKTARLRNTWTISPKKWCKSPNLQK